MEEQQSSSSLEQQLKTLPDKIKEIPNSKDGAKSLFGLAVAIATTFGAIYVAGYLFTKGAIAAGKN